MKNTEKDRQRNIVNKKVWILSTLFRMEIV